MAEYLSNVAEQLGNGEHVTGPAAGRLIAAARAATASFGGIYLSPKDAAALLAEPAFQVHDNPQALLTCNYDPSKALCDPERRNGQRPRRGQPSLDRCDVACANIARTDTHIDLARHEAGNRQTLIANPLTPQPLHRLANITHADRIFILDRGALVEAGTHAELMAAGGIYSQLFTLQAAGYQSSPA